MRYTLLNPSQRSAIRDRAMVAFPCDWRRHYDYMLEVQENKVRAAFADRRFTRDEARGEFKASMIWFGITWLLGSFQRLAFVTRAIALNGLSHALYFRFPFLMRRYSALVQLTMFLGVMATILGLLMWHFDMNLEEVVQAFQYAPKWLVRTTITRL